jgi:small subunit ribosomal protein S20
MANTKSAIKAFKQSEKRHMANVARKSSIKTAIKKVHEALEKHTSKIEVDKLVSSAASLLGRAKGKLVLHKNTSARKLSRLMLKVNKHFATTTEISK